ncbi:MAG: HlyD family efflux transporter periplasmic adaptor subunit, partial [Proteobacteria bacterium]|nr:HlyD family efflux transporter periplasmic adaptor subunit [Pseudomonadota bacterium]
LVLQSGAADGAGDTPQSVAIGYPIMVNDQVRGAAAIEVDQAPDDEVRLAMDQLEWGCGWLESLIRRGRVTSSDRLATVIELLATSLHYDRFQTAATAVATELAGTLECERVSIGFLKGQHVRLRALSHSASFGKKANVIRAIEAAMDEAIDQQAVVLYPVQEGGPDQVTRAHAALLQDHNTGPICTVPLAEGRRLLGALTLERPVGEAFDTEAVQLCEHIAALLGPILDVKRREDRWLPRKAVDSARNHLGKLIGPRHIGFKLGVFATVALVAFFTFAMGDYRITAPISLEGKVQRAVVTPFEGYVKSAFARAGDLVTAGQVLAELDDTDLSLEHLRWTTERQQRLMEYDQALASHERADVNVIRAKIEQAAAQIALLNEHLSRAKLTAPFDGIVVSGDLSQSIGAPVQRGELLFEIAPLDAYRVILEVDEREIADVAVGQSGALVVSSAPDDPIAFLIERITPVSEARGGRNYFRVEARLTGDIDYTRLRPGMEGVGKITVDRRRLFWIGTYKMVNWAQLWLWKWTP